MIRCCGHKYDLDDVFSYSTPRTATIRDRKLGLCFRLGLLLVFVYIALFDILFQKQYRALGSLYGVTRMSMRSPPDKYRGEKGYCGNGTVDYNGFISSQLPCAYMDALDAVYPAVEAGQVFLTTRFVRINQVLSGPECANLCASDCGYVNASWRFAYVADPEMFTLRINHNINVPSFRLSLSATNMKGRMIGQDGNTIDVCDAYKRKGVACPSYVHVGQSDSAVQGDTFPVAALLQAAGIDSLDASSHVDSSMRFDGAILVVSIVYTNYDSYDPNRVSYTMSVEHVANTEFKVVESFPAPGVDGPTRQLLNRHGIRILITQSGTIGRFAFQTLLVQLVSTFGLVAVITMVMDLFLQYCAASKFIYRQYKTVSSLKVAQYTEDELHALQINPDTSIPDHLRQRLRSASQGDASTASGFTGRRRSSSDARGCCGGLRWHMLGWREYCTWFCDWFRRISAVYRDTVLPPSTEYIAREHPALALCNRQQRRGFRTIGWIGRAVILGIGLAVEFTVAMGVACAQGWNLHTPLFLGVFYVMGVAVGILTFSLCSAIVKQFGRREAWHRVGVIIMLGALVAAAVAPVVLLSLALVRAHLTESRASIVLRCGVHAVIALVTTLLVEVPFHFLLRLCKPTGVSLLLLVCACCRLRTTRPWEHPQRFQEFFERETNVDVGATSDNDSTASYVPMVDSKPGRDRDGSGSDASVGEVEVKAS